MISTVYNLDNMYIGNEENNLLGLMSYINLRQKLLIDLTYILYINRIKVLDL